MNNNFGFSFRLITPNPSCATRRAGGGCSLSCPLRSFFFLRMYNIRAHLLFKFKRHRNQKEMGENIYQLCHDVGPIYFLINPEIETKEWRSILDNSSRTDMEHLETARLATLPKCGIYFLLLFGDNSKFNFPFVVVFLLLAARTDERSGGGVSRSIFGSTKISAVASVLKCCPTRTAGTRHHRKRRRETSCYT